MAKRTNTELAFSAIRIEGGLLAADFLGRVARFEATGQTEADYDIPKGLKLRDEIGRYWKIALNLWQEFNTGRQRTDHDTHGFTSKDFLEPFCRHVLGFSDIQSIGQVVLEERIFPIGYQAVGGQVPLVFAAHSLGMEQSDARFGDGHRRRSPFLLTQEYLNAEDQCLWAIVSNGLRLRVLRDNPSLTRPAYIEVDLEAIFNEERYPDFTALWLLAHATRFGGHQVARSGNPADCHLERWRNTSQESGIRARERLRDGVGEALRALGTGFIGHPRNTVIRDQLDTGALSAQAYYEQLLRLIYRFIFLATLEDRQDEQRGTALVFAPDADEAAQKRYLQGYSLNRLRDHAAKRRHYDRYGDLWQSLRITFSGLDKGQPALGLPALGGLFTTEQCPLLDSAQLENRYLLQAVFGLCFFREGAALTRVNYRDMDSEELGSVYESLLELVPFVSGSAANRKFGFIGDDEEASTKGNARKLSGSYYTPDSLVQELIKSALEPVIEKTLKDNPEQPVKALLELTVCDPACGSGHFLLAAVRRIADEVARLNSSEGNPLQSDYRHALRDVVAHCIYGVDKNPMAVELAKTALWLEAYTPDRPLTFIDHHLRCGDALLGVLDPATLEKGIPSEAFNAFSGDDKAVVKALKKANSDAIKAIERSKSNAQYMRNFEFDGATESRSLEALPDDTLEDIAAKRSAFAQAEAHAAQSRAYMAADLFVAAFVIPKTPNNQLFVPTSQDLWLVMNGGTPRPGVQEAATKAAHIAQTFHWHLAFPQIFSDGQSKKKGFDVLLGNPPWEVSQLSEEEYFSARAPSIAAMAGEQRKRAIAALEQDNLMLWNSYVNDCQKIAATNTYYRESGRYPFTAFGKLNTYALFADTFVQLLAAKGRSGFIVPSGIGTDDTNKRFFQSLVEDKKLISFLGFDNARRIFPSVHSDTPFALVTIGQSDGNSVFAHYILSIEQLADVRRHFSLSQDEFALINPNTRTCPILRSQYDVILTKKLYQSAPVLIAEKEENGNRWNVEIIQNFFSTSNKNDRALFILAKDVDAFDDLLPVFRGTMIDQFDHHASTYSLSTDSFVDVQIDQHQDVESYSDKYLPIAEVRDRLFERGWQRRWLLGWRDITNATNKRTLIASVLPVSGTDDTLSLILPHLEDARLAACLLANLNSLVLDYIAQIKVGGTHVRKYVISQLPIIPPDVYLEADIRFVLSRVIELTYTTEDMKPWAEDLGYDGSPFFFNTERRAVLRAELDAYYARLYGITRDELRYILDPSDLMGADYPSETFSVLKRSELKEFHEYRTARLVLREFDRMALADATHEPYLSLLVPPPGQPSSSQYSAIGIIRDEDDARLAGLVLAIIRQAGALSRQSLTLALSAAHTSGATTVPLEKAELDQLVSYRQSHQDMLQPARLERMQLMLRFFEDAGAIRIEQQGAWIAVASDVLLPVGVSVEKDTEEVAGVLLRTARANLERQAADDLDTTSQASSKQV